jgi:signal transduction histidine kinase
MKLQSKLMLSFVIVGVVSVVITGVLTFQNARSAIERITFDRLTSIRETKKRQVESYFAQMRNQIVSSASDRTIVELARELKRTSGRGPIASLGFLEDFRQRFGYADILIADASDGTLLLSVRKSGGTDASRHTGVGMPENLARVLRQVQASPLREVAYLADFSVARNSRHAPASFLAAPILENGQPVAVLVYQISIDHINQLMTSGGEWKAEGLGETGETYIVGEDGLMRNDSRFFIQEPERYFRLLKQRYRDTTLIRDIRARATSILLQEVRTPAVEEALHGRTATRIVDDYRGVKVISAYTPLRIEGVRWAMLAEIDVQEAFASAAALREQLILGGLVIVLIGSAVAVFMARTISRPILRLARSAERFGAGELTQRVDAAGNDEIGQLGRSFNEMADGIARQTALLHAEIAERMQAEQALREAGERLRQLSAHLQTAREKERMGIARDIHDELGQALTTMKLELSIIREEHTAEGDSARQRIDTLQHLIDATIRSVQRIITDLRPRLLDDLGLVAAVEWQARDFQKRTGIACALEILPVDFTLDPDRSIAIFRILQETLTNVARHARADAVRIRLERTDFAIELHVRDDGRGIPSDALDSATSFGLIGMRERAEAWGGTLEIEGAPDAGTRVVVRVPFQPQENP